MHKPLEEILQSIFEASKGLLKIGPHIFYNFPMISSFYSLSKDGKILPNTRSDHFIRIYPHCLKIYSTGGNGWFSTFLADYSTDDFDTDEFFNFWRELDPMSFRSALELLTEEHPHDDR
jgi:hypothetical protein